MKANEKIVGLEMRSQSHKKVEVLRAVKNSRVKVEVKVIDRGEGYDSDLKRYTGVKTAGGWCRGENKEFGKIDELHIDELEKI